MSDKKAKTPAAEKKIKMVRDSFTMPKQEYAAIDTLKARALAMQLAAKKSELLRAGLLALSAMDDASLKMMLSAVPTLKTGRPKKTEPASTDAAVPTAAPAASPAALPARSRRAAPVRARRTAAAAPAPAAAAPAPVRTARKTSARPAAAKRAPATAKRAPARKAA